MLLYVLKLNQNAKMPEAYGKYYAYPVITQTVDIDGLAEHMASHNTPFSKGAIKGMITDMVSCIKELTLQGFAVKIVTIYISIHPLNHLYVKAIQEMLKIKNDWI